MEATSALQGGGTGASSLRVVFVRHGKQIESRNRKTARDKWDPPLSVQGRKQAELLARHLSVTEAGGQPIQHACVCVTSPMRRALMTAIPTAGTLNCPIVCHGGLYEYGCAGLAQPGSSTDELRAECPGLEFEGFSAAGRWDYQGSAQKETEADARLRATRFVEWLHADVLSSRRPLTLVFAHQTYLNLVLRLLLEPETGGLSWSYGSNKYSFQHTACAELQFDSTGSRQWRLTVLNDARHLDGFDAAMKEGSGVCEVL